MFVQHSEELNRLVAQKSDAGCFAQIRKKAMFERQGRFHSTVDVVESLARHGLFMPGVSVTRVTLQRGSITFTFLFAGNVDAVYAMVRAIPIPKKGKTASSVLVKMAHMRVRNLQKSIDMHNEFVERYRENQPHMKERLKTIPDIRRSDIESPDQLYGIENAAFYGQPNRPFSEMRKFIARDDVTSDVVQAGWDLFQVERVQES